MISDYILVDKKGPYSVKRCRFCYNVIWGDQVSAGDFCDIHCKNDGLSQDRKIKSKEKKDSKSTSL